MLGPSYFVRALEYKITNPFFDMNNPRGKRIYRVNKLSNQIQSLINNT